MARTYINEHGVRVCERAQSTMNKEFKGVREHKENRIYKMDNNESYYCECIDRPRIYDLILDEHNNVIMAFISNEHGKLEEKYITK